MSSSKSSSKSNSDQPTREEMKAGVVFMQSMNSDSAVLLSSAYALLSQACLHYADDPGPMGSEIDRFTKLFFDFLNKNVKTSADSMAAGIVAVSVAYTLARENAADISRAAPMLDSLLDTVITPSSETVN